MILTTFAIITLMSLFCVGLFIMMQEGQILAFMREPFIEMMEQDNKEHKDNVASIKSKYSTQKELNHGTNDKYKMDLLREEYNSNIEWEKIRHKKAMARYMWLKSFCICVYCFASLWGSLVFWGLHYFYYNDATQLLIPIWILSCVICVVFNAVIESICHQLNIT